jgi:hypothetical protein
MKHQRCHEWLKHTSKAGDILTKYLANQQYFHVLNYFNASMEIILISISKLGELQENPTHLWWRTICSEVYFNTDCRNKNVQRLASE